MIRNAKHGKAYKLNFDAAYNYLCARHGEPTDRSTSTAGSSITIVDYLAATLDGNAHLPARAVQATAGVLDAHEVWCLQVDTTQTATGTAHR